jgi:hypothetical protein
MNRPVVRHECRAFKLRPPDRKRPGIEAPADHELAIAQDLRTMTSALAAAMEHDWQFDKSR